MAQHVTEFGRDGRPAAPDGRLDAPAFHRNHAADLGGAGEVPRGPNRRRAGGRQRHRPARGALRPPKPRHHLVAERFQRRASEEHRGLARAARLAEHPAAAADRPLRSRLVPAPRATAAVPENCSRCSAPMSSTSRHGASRKAWSRALRGTCATTGGCSSTGRSSATAGIPRVSNAVFDTSLRVAGCGMGRARRRRCCKAGGRRRSGVWPKHSKCPPTT